MKRITFTLLLISIITIGYGQRTIKKDEVTEKGYNTFISFTPIKDEINYNGLKIKIIPTSAEKLNSQFIHESTINGKFDYTYYNKSRNSYFLQKKRRKHIKSDFEYLSEGANWLLDNGKINQKEYNELINKIMYCFYEKSGDIKKILDGTFSSNPYFFQGKYLSVFKIEFINSTKSDITFKGLFTIQNGNAIYSPLSDDFITKELYATNLLNVNKSLILERHNLKEPIVIPSGSHVEKLFAVIPINYMGKYLEISLKDSDTKFKYQVNKRETIINKTYSYYEFNIEPDYSSSEINSIYDFNLSSEEPAMFLEGNKLFIDANHMNEKFEIITLSLDASGSLYYGRNSNLKGNDFVNFEKKRRKPIVLELEKIKGLKKKVNQ